MLSFLRHPQNANLTPARGEMSVVWIDGVGCFWLSQKDRLTIGGPGSPPEKPATAESTDLALLSDLQRRHATIVRTGEGYLLASHGPTRVNNREIRDQVGLTDGALIELGRSVRLKFRQPSALSLSARLDFESDHRPTQSLDAVVLLADTCLIGPSDDNHIVCPDWTGQVLLVRKGAELWCRSQQTWTVNGHRLGSGRRLQSGDIVAGDDSRFRIEIPN